MERSQGAGVMEGRENQQKAFTNNKLLYKHTIYSPLLILEHNPVLFRL